MVTKRPAHKWLAPDIELDLRNQIEKAKNETYEEWVEGSFELYIYINSLMILDDHHIPKTAD